MMIRYKFIENQVLRIYQQLPKIEFPINIENIIKYFPNCRYMSYQLFSKIGHCSVNDVINFCESKSGCTHYDMSNNRYLILCNHSTDNNNNPGRQRWTAAHELGHVVCDHHIYANHVKLAENNISVPKNNFYEIEADYFASVLLAPFPLFQLFGVKSSLDVCRIFGLSNEASNYRFRKYQEWQTVHYKTAWENNMIKLYRFKTVKLNNFMYYQKIYLKLIFTPLSNNYL